MKYIVKTEINGAEVYSDIFNSKEEAEAVAETMLQNWGFNCLVIIYDSEPSHDGYDYNRYY